MGALYLEAWYSRKRTKDPLLRDADYLYTLHRKIYIMCAAMIAKFVTIAALTVTGLASPVPVIADIVGCVNSWDSWGIACPNLGHHLFCDNLPGIRAGT